jgi:two-component system, chemotaxis family, chemotaxis protein CheY
MAWRVLVIDDEEEVRKVVRLHLTKEGFDVIEAEDGDKGIEMVQAGDNPLMLSAIVCDVRMPKINGVDTIDYIRKAFPSTPVIVLTGFPDVQLAVDLMKKGVKDYLVKPVSKDQLVAAVQKAIKERDWSPETLKRI